MADLWDGSARKSEDADCYLDRGQGMCPSDYGNPPLSSIPEAHGLPATVAMI